MATKTANLELTEIQEVDSPGYESFNDSFWKLDSLVQPAVLSRVVTVAPTTAIQGDRYIVPDSGIATTSPWYKHNRQVAYMTPDGWEFASPRRGWKFLVLDETESVSPQEETSVIFTSFGEWVLSQFGRTGDPLTNGTFQPASIVVSGGRITAVGAYAIPISSLPDTGVAPGDYFPMRATVNSKGLITDADDGDGVSGSFTTADITVVNGIVVAASDGTSATAGASNITADTHPLTANAWDDEFEYGTGVDTTGARFSGANAWSWFNQGTQTGVIRSGSLLMTTSNNIHDNISGITQAITATDDFDIECKVSIRTDQNNRDVRAGLVIRCAAGDTMIFGWYCNAGTQPPKFFINCYGAPDGANINTFTFPNADDWRLLGTRPIYFRIINDHTTGTLLFYVSADGITSPLLTSLSYSNALGTSGKTPDYVGIGVSSSAGALISNGFPSTFDWFRRHA